MIQYAVDRLWWTESDGRRIIFDDLDKAIECAKERSKYCKIHERIEITVIGWE